MTRICYQRILSLLFVLVALTSSLHAQVSLPERNPCKLSFRGGALSNNADMAAFLKSKTELDNQFTVNTNYTALGEAELAVDIFRFRGAGIGMQVSGLYCRPEFRAKKTGIDQRVALTEMQMVRMNLTVSFNGTDPYTMFELPYHSNKEAVLGVTGMIVRTQNTKLTPYATDSLMIKKISGDYCQALGVTFGWNWRLGESGWVLGINGAVMFVINKSHLAKIEMEDESKYKGDYLDFAPRLITAGLGYHF